jgi:hypothetical protein
MSGTERTIRQFDLETLLQELMKTRSLDPGFKKHIKYVISRAQECMESEQYINARG